MKPLKCLLCCIVLWLISIDAAFAQNGAFLDRDYRIAKYEKDIILYLIKEKQVMDIKTPFNIEDYKSQIRVWKCLEIYSNDTTKNLLLIGFSTSADHSDRFWGVLTSKSKYFFYDIDDTTEAELSMFKKTYNPVTAATILFYCYQNPPYPFGIVSMGSHIYSRYLNIIKDALHNKEGLRTRSVDSAKLFLQNITGIKPESNGFKSGRFHLTQEDYTKWLYWFRKNNSNLDWDEKSGKVSLRKGNN
jgi:hypothetical protein